MENEGGFCIVCDHKHRGVDQCSYCDCTWQSTEEDDMVKKIIRWVWNIICWPIKKIKNWLWS